MARQPRKPDQPRDSNPRKSPRPPLKLPRTPARTPSRPGMPGLGGTIQPPTPDAAKGPSRPPVRPRQPNKQGAGGSRRGQAVPRSPSSSSIPPVPARRPQGRQRPVSSGSVKPQRREPVTIRQIIPALVRYAVRHEDGLTISEFDRKFLPRIRALAPESGNGAGVDTLSAWLLDTAHALYVAGIQGEFSNRPVLCGVRATEVGSVLAERALKTFAGRDETRVTAIRAENLLSGLAMHAVRLLETASMIAQPLNGFTESFERAVLTTYGLKAKAEEAGSAPWQAPKAPSLEKRIGSAVNTMSNVFGDYIGEHGEHMNDTQYDEVLHEFDDFMHRFAAYVDRERGSPESRQRRQPLESGPDSTVVPAEPLTIAKLIARPAGVEIVLVDGRKLFVSQGDARRIGQCADEDS
jgi:hypothetical protein